MDFIKSAISGLTDKELFSAWEATNTETDEYTPAIRGLLMEEIESRYPEQFAAWMATEDMEKIDHPELFI